jgi:hypothetical protein
MSFSFQSPFIGLARAFAFRDRNMIDGSARKQWQGAAGPSVDAHSQDQCFAKLVIIHLLQSLALCARVSRC